MRIIARPSLCASAVSVSCHYFSKLCLSLSLLSVCVRCTTHNANLLNSTRFYSFLPPPSTPFLGRCTVHAIWQQRFLLVLPRPFSLTVYYTRVESSRVERNGTSSRRCTAFSIYFVAVEMKLRRSRRRKRGGGFIILVAVAADAATAALYKVSLSL